MAQCREVGGGASLASFEGGEAVSEHLLFVTRCTEFGVGNLLRVGHKGLQLLGAVSLGIVEGMLRGS